MDTDTIRGTRGRSRSRSREREERRAGKERYRSRSPPARRSASPPRRRHQSGSRSPSRRDRNNTHKRRRSRSRSSGSSSSDHSTRRHRKKDKGKEKDRHQKEKRRRRSGSRSRSRSRERDKDRERRKERKERKREKKEKKRQGAVTSQWGKHGLITETDIYTKEQEFHLWLLEEQHQNIETLSKPAQKKFFQTFMEDFNTATLPHEKYYALEPYERRMALVRSGGTLPIDDGYDPNKDLVEHTKSTKRVVNDETDTYLSREQLIELRKVQLERTQVGKMKQMGLEVKGSMGVRMDGSHFD
ncbi:hypothetical protein FRB96_009707 [Tulasnella sp. 330]|nr:hypothetical protein FRB96_009707 [Tulasnella sp. 330]KAG8869152.1 hypothetical protein FRB97_001564 [Tulasnella sp. 331]KAG8870439.1 hypothetical protein FRB98_001632 [Tulasnella sp. 332]